MSWRVLMKDRELIMFPIMSAIGVLIVIGLFFGAAAATGTLDRLDLARQGSGATEDAQLIDYLLAVALYASTTFVVIFFNAALVAAALERLRGGDPNISSGLRAALAHLPAILVWALISATVGLILQLLRDKMDNFIGHIVLSLIGGVWAYMTFFVIPVLVAEGTGPIEGIKRSAGLFQRTWGRQVASSFGFTLVYLIAVVVAVLPAVLLFAVSPLLGIVFGAFTIPIAVGTVQAMEGIFKAALYEFALGETPLDFDRGTLSGAYRAL
ncbi:MAG: hypothetical protein DWG75_00420 [Chloroflexi bacterium]|nr:hypothetical protein [Chloroflexota bacterium]